jgi:glycosyltransferase involved in cell wall biosynthesis
MIILYHKNNEVASVFNASDGNFLDVNSKKISTCLFELSLLFDEELIIWCHVSQKENLNFDAISQIFRHKKIMASFTIGLNYLPDGIGYVEESLFINISRDKTYPTWQMSGLVGGINSSVLKALDKDNFKEKNFDYLLCSIAKRLMPVGLQVYSEPQLLLLKEDENILNQGTTADLFKFVRQHYRIVWIFLLFLDFVIYERKFPVLGFLRSLFYQKKAEKISLDFVDISPEVDLIKSDKIDVLIPTIGRKKYLFDFLTDLASQTLLPQNVIIVEQNPKKGSVSELDYLQQETWPFKIKALFTHQSGACNARNRALELVENDWIFFADDDIRIEKSFLQNSIAKTQELDNNAFTFNCKQKDENTRYHQVFQWPTFGSGCSFVHKNVLEGLKFDMGFEFGFGEDADFGMQIRKKGFDVLYLPHPQIMHLKAPVGGFRTKPALPWDNEKILPKPAPTILLYFLKHLSAKQLSGYKTVLFLKYYKLQSIRNPVNYYYNFQKQWDISLSWALKLKEKRH